ncbi:MAG: FCD domain-containing protein [Acidimicrobiaceae bacterium]|nr:FCD domain-containing protein [Acidimicrobiaceae bacterium]
MALTAKGSTRNESIYLDIRRNLLRGEFGPGHRFKLSELCAESGMSVSVVREALTRLAEQGLIRSEPHKGFYVPSYTVEQIKDIAFMRAELESLAITLSVERGAVDWEASVVAAHHELALTPRALLSEDPEANERWSLAHGAFHRACAAGCGSPRLIALRQALYDEAEILRQMAGLHGRTQRDVEGEHAGISQAVIQRDAALASRLVKEHIAATAVTSVNAWTAATHGEG